MILASATFQEKNQALTITLNLHITHMKTNPKPQLLVQRISQSLQSKKKKSNRISRSQSDTEVEDGQNERIDRPKRKKSEKLSDDPQKMVHGLKIHTINLEFLRKNYLNKSHDQVRRNFMKTLQTKKLLRNSREKPQPREQTSKNNYLLP